MYALARPAALTFLRRGFTIRRHKFRDTRASPPFARGAKGTGRSEKHAPARRAESLSFSSSVARVLPPAPPSSPFLFRFFEIRRKSRPLADLAPPGHAVWKRACGGFKRVRLSALSGRRGESSKQTRRYIVVVAVLPVVIAAVFVDDVDVVTRIPSERGISVGG